MTIFREEDHPRKDNGQFGNGGGGGGSGGGGGGSGRGEGDDAGRMRQLAASATMPRAASNFAQAREAVKQFQGKPLKNGKTGMVATVSRNSLDKMLSESAIKKSESPASHALAVANLDTLFARAVQG